MSLAGTGRSTTGKTGRPVARSSTKTNPILVAITQPADHGRRVGSWRAGAAPPRRSPICRGVWSESSRLASQSRRPALRTADDERSSPGRSPPKNAALGEAVDRNVMPLAASTAVSVQTLPLPPSRDTASAGDGSNCQSSASPGIERAHGGAGREGARHVVCRGADDQRVVQHRRRPI
jgi:hypothetical protein